MRRERRGEEEKMAGPEERTVRWGAARSQDNRARPSRPDTWYQNYASSEICIKMGVHGAMPVTLQGRTTVVPRAAVMLVVDGERKEGRAGCRAGSRKLSGCTRGPWS